MTEATIHWDPIFPLLPTLLGGLVVMAVLVYLEYRRKLKYRTLRIFAQILFVTCVTLLFVRPTIASNQSRSSILLLTDGYDESDVDRLITEDRSLRLFTTPGTKPYKNSTALQSLNELSRIGREISGIAGAGLPQWAIELMGNHNFVFHHPGTTGISTLDLPNQVFAHRWNKLSGTYDLDSGTVTLKLRGPGGMEDSVTLTGSGRLPFALSFFTRAPGRFNYELITPGSTEILPLTIEAEKELAITIISDYPTFEVRFLKNFLATKGHRLSIRTQVSKGRFKFEFANRASAEFPTLSTSILGKTDLLLIDERSWQALSSGEQRNVRSAITDGLGVLTLPEQAPGKKPTLLPFDPVQVKDTVTVRLERAGTVNLPVLTLITKEPTISMMSSTDGRIVSGYVESGAGKIGYQLLQETYRVGLENKMDTYAALWVPLLEKCARKLSDEYSIRITSPFPVYENEPIDFSVVGAGKKPEVKVDDHALPVSEDLRVDDLWHGRVWLEGNSWHRITADSTTKWIHVAKVNAWRELRASNHARATALASAESSSQGIAYISYDDRMVKVILFTLLLIAAAFLWLSPKL